VIRWKCILMINWLFMLKRLRSLRPFRHDRVRTRGFTTHFNWLIRCLCLNYKGPSAHSGTAVWRTRTHLSDLSITYKPMASSSRCIWQMAHSGQQDRDRQSLQIEPWNTHRKYTLRGVFIKFSDLGHSITSLCVYRFLIFFCYDTYDTIQYVLDRT